MTAHPLRSAAIVLMLSFAAGAQTETQPALAPLVPPKAPWLKKPPAPQPPIETQLPITPLVPAELPPPLLKLSNTLGVFVENDGLPAPAAARMEESLRGVAKLAPMIRGVSSVVRPGVPCMDDACWAAVAGRQSFDQILVASYAGGKLRLRLVDVFAKKLISEGEQAGVAPEAEEAVAWAEALACRMLVPAGCTGEAAFEAGEGVQLELDGQPLARGEKRKLAVGVHVVKARTGAKLAERKVPVLRAGSSTVYARAVDGQPRFLTAADMVPRAAVASAESAPAGQPRRWTRAAGYAGLGAGALVAAAGVYLGAKSRSDLNSAENRFHANGNVYRPGDLDALNSGNSKARSANALFLASGVLLAAGAVFTFAF